MNIGKFTYDAKTDIFAGNITTLTFHVGNVELRPAEKSSDKAPDYRLFAERHGSTVEFGSAWKKRGGQNDTEYLSVVIDDPTLSGSLNAAMFPSADGDTAALVWNRPKAAPAKTKKK